MALYTVPLTNAVLELTNKCNLRCRHCASDSGKSRPDEMDTRRMLHLIDELSDLGCQELTLLGGEIFLRDDWFSIAKEATDKGMRLILISNGLLLDDENYSKLKEIPIYLIGLSIDGASSEMYKEMRGVDGFAKVLGLLNKMVADDHFPHVNAITTFTRENLSAWHEFVSLFDETAITWQVQLANKGGSRFDEEQFLTREEYAWFFDTALQTLDEHPNLRLRFMDDFGYCPITPKLAFLHETWHGCIAGKELVGIRSDGLVCGCLSLGEKFMEASLKEHSLKHIWQSNEFFQGFRRRQEHLSGSCGGCEVREKCGGGCAAMALSSTGKLGENSYCIRQIEKERLTDEIW